MTKERIVILILLIFLIWFGANLVRLENYHYTVQVGMCNEYNENILNRFTERENCINNTKTRTSFIWHLLYGLKILN